MKIKQLNEDHEAVKVNYYGGSWGDEPINVYTSSNSLKLYLKRIPTELELKGNRFTIYEDEEYQQARDAVKELRKTNEEEAKKLDALLFNIRYIDRKTKSEEAFREEISEFLQHITTYFKSRLIQLSHEMNEETKKHRDEAIKKVNAELKRLGAI